MRILCIFVVLCSVLFGVLCICVVLLVQCGDPAGLSPLLLATLDSSARLLLKCNYTATILLRTILLRTILLHTILLPYCYIPYCYQNAAVLLPWCKLAATKVQASCCHTWCYAHMYCYNTASTINSDTVWLPYLIHMLTCLQSFACNSCSSSCWRYIRDVCLPKIGWIF